MYYPGQITGLAYCGLCQKNTVMKDDFAADKLNLISFM